MVGMPLEANRPPAGSLSRCAPAATRGLAGHMFTLRDHDDGYGFDASGVGSRKSNGDDINDTGHNATVRSYVSNPPCHDPNGNASTMSMNSCIRCSCSSVYRPVFDPCRKMLRTRIRKYPHLVGSIPSNSP